MVLLLWVLLVAAGVLAVLVGAVWLVGKSLPGGSPVDVLRFQQSLVFTDGGSNRSEEQIRAIREACRGHPADVANPAGLDDPRCATQ